MTETKQEGDDECTSPETECLALAGLEQPRIDAGEPSGEREKQIAAVEVLLKKTNDQEAEEPDCAVSEDVGAEEEPALDARNSDRRQISRAIAQCRL